MQRTVIAGALGNCVHVAGVVEFLRTADKLGYKTEFLGAAVSVDRFIEKIRATDPEIVGVSYRLTPDVGLELVRELKTKLEQHGLANRRFVFGGTPPVCKLVRQLGWFERCFDGLENENEVWSYLKGSGPSRENENPGDTLIERIESKHPYPILRHHFGLPDLEETIRGVRRIAESRVLDVISVAPDQNAQESFFRPEALDSRLDGAGGAPVRSESDLRALYEASRTGNYPLLRIYSGTRDLIKWAEIAAKTIHNAWGAIPLCWYSVLDGRSDRTSELAIRKNQECMRWYGERRIPVEVNEAHHWAMRDAHDVVSVVMAYLAAYNAKRMGVSLYVSQYMFNSPAGISGAMDLAKILAQMELVESLHTPDFFSVRQVRAGLLHLSPVMNKAKGQLAASTVLALSIRPHIIHVVGYCEGDHAASADDVIESCEIVQGVMRNCLFGMPDMTLDPVVQERKEEILREAEVLLSVIRETGNGDIDPLASPRVIASAILRGIIDAPHLRGNPFASGLIETRVIDGAVYAVDREKKHAISEVERLNALLQNKDLARVH